MKLFKQQRNNGSFFILAVLVFPVLASPAYAESESDKLAK